MLKHLHVRNFTVFADAEFAFGPGLNVVVGANGTGKSHVLKLGYAAELAREAVAYDHFEDYERNFIDRGKLIQDAEWVVMTRVLRSVFLAKRWQSLIRQTNSEQVANLRNII